MTDDAHHIAMHEYRIENLERKMTALTDNVLGLVKSSEIINAAIRTFHDTQEQQAKTIEAHSKAIEENKTDKKAVAFAWKALCFICGMIVTAVGIFGMFWPFLHKQ